MTYEREQCRGLRRLRSRAYYSTLHLPLGSIQSFQGNKLIKILGSSEIRSMKNPQDFFFDFQRKMPPFSIVSWIQPLQLSQVFNYMLLLPKRDKLFNPLNRYLSEIQSTCTLFIFKIFEVVNSFGENLIKRQRSENFGVQIREDEYLRPDIISHKKS